MGLVYFFRVAKIISLKHSLDQVTLYLVLAVLHLLIKGKLKALYFHSPKEEDSALPLLYLFFTLS